MPFVSTFSSQQQQQEQQQRYTIASSINTTAATNSRRHSATVARCPTTRKRLLEDERRRSTNEVPEMDGTGLHERENWPLRDKAPAFSLARLSVKEVPHEHEVEADAVVRNTEDFGQEPAVMPVEQKAVGVGKDVRVVGETEDGQNHVDVQETILDMPERSVDQDVSPLRTPARGSGAGTPSASSDSTSPALLPGERWNNSWVLADRRQSTVSPRAERRTFTNPAAFHEDDEQGEAEPAQDREREVSGDTSDDELYEDEGRDIATPIPFARDVAGTPTSPPSYHSDRATPVTNGHSRQSSLFKGTPPQRNVSRRSISIGQVANDMNVRYSWQSLQDDEPNRPRINIIKLVSNTVTASAGFPQGEAFGFSMSPAGRRIAAYNSARLYILQTAALPVGISQDYALKRKPMAVEVIDDGNTLAILADEHTVNIYDLGHQRLKRIRTIKLDFPANCIALGPTGGLLAAAYEGGIEIFSLDPGALPTDRRAVRCVRMDRMMFSADGSTLLGTTTRINISSTVVVSVPVFPAAANGIPTHEELKEAWCSELLHPENIRNSSHASFMREDRKNCNERVFAWNGLADTFGVLNVGDMQYGNVDYPVVISPPLSTCGGLGAAMHSCPAIDERGDTVAMIVNDRTIRLYIVPHDVEDGETTVEAHSIDHELDEGYGCPFSEVRWVHSSASLPAPFDLNRQVQGRLVVTSPGAVVEESLGEEMVEDIEGGRIILFDFDPQFTGQPGQTFSLTLGKSPPQLLDEPEVDVADEVALVRRRTVNQSKSGGLSQKPIALGRAATTAGGQLRDRSLQDEGSGGTDPASRRSVRPIYNPQSVAARSVPDILESNEGFDTFEEPYAQNAPRSQASLQRAASNAQRHRFQTLEERNQERASVDSNGAFLPLPEYTAEPNAPLPSRFRAMAGLDALEPRPQKRPVVVTNVNGDHVNPVLTGPSTAPAGSSETFDAEQAFSAAMSVASISPTTQPRSHRESVLLSSSAGTSPRSSTRPASRGGTVNSTQHLPRSLQRAYANAANLPLGSGPPPALIGDWENVSPIIGIHARPNPTGSSPASSRERSWDGISPAGTVASASTSRYSTIVDHPHRYSTPLGPISVHNPSSVTRSLSNASSYHPRASATSSTTSSRLPPHIQAFRNAATTSANASLFPPHQPPDHVPLRNPPSRAGTVAHPITAWHPPAPSIASVPASTSGAAGASRTLHSRRSSLSQKSAFASTAKARRLGFFRSGTQKKKPFSPEYTNQGRAGRKGGGGGSGRPFSRDGGADSVFETRSMFTTFTRGEGKCAIM